MTRDASLIVEPVAPEAAVPATLTTTLPEGGLDLVAELDRYEAWMVTQALVQALGNKARAAKLLGLNRTTLVMKLKEPHLRAFSRVLAREQDPVIKQPTDPSVAVQAHQSRIVDGVEMVSRVEIARLRALGLTPAEIATKIGCSRYLVERELRTQQPLAKCGAR